MDAMLGKLSAKGRVAFEGVTGDLDWWQTSIIYQIYPRSFQDSKGDGVGDLPGIISRLDHVKSLGVGAVWLSPFYKSPMRDHGYDIADFKDIDPLFGNMDDFTRLADELHKRGMKLIVDYVPNHTSDLHPWFQESRKSRDNAYSDYYIWHDGKMLKDGTRAPPNNWLGCFGGSAWTWEPARRQYYYRQYLPEQPDLNWRNPDVVEQMERILEFWLDRGVDGFRVDAIASLYEDPDLTKDEPLSGDPDFLPGMSKYLDHVYTRHQQETYDAVAKWRNFFDLYEKLHNRTHIYCIVELYDRTMDHQMKFYTSGADGAFNFNLVEVTSDMNALDIFEMVDSWLAKMPKGKWPNWVTGNHDRRRVSGRKGPRFVNAFNMLLLLLPGTATTYQGEEIGMLDIEVSYEMTQDPCARNAGPDFYQRFTRDPGRSPMQWSADKNAGFSHADNTWLPLHPEYRRLNVQVQDESSDPFVPLGIYRNLSRLRNNPSFQKGSMIYGPVSKDIISFVRHAAGFSPYLVIFNFGNNIVKEDFTVSLNGLLYTTGAFVISAQPFENEISGGKVNLSSVSLAPAQAVVFKLE